MSTEHDNSQNVQEEVQNNETPEVNSTNNSDQTEELGKVAVESDLPDTLNINYDDGVDSGDEDDVQNEDDEIVVEDVEEKDPEHVKELKDSDNTEKDSDHVREVKRKKQRTYKKDNYVPNEKYTKIDNLSEDKLVNDQKWVCISFLSPEGVMNTKLRGVKVREGFKTREEAEKHCEKLQKEDKYFDIFVGEMGKWLPWDPDPTSISNAKYKDKRMQKLVDTQNKRNQQKLNELVGRKKELMDKKKKGHKRHVADQILAGAHEEGGGSVKSADKKKSKPQKKNPRAYRASRLDQIRSRLRKKAENKRKKTNQDVSKQHEEAVLKEQKSKQETNIKARSEELEKKKEASSKIEKNIDKIRKYMASKK